MPRKKFEPPSEKDVALYMVSQHHVKPARAVVEAEKFIGYWESMGWERPGGKMRSWKGSVATWCGNLPGDAITGKGIMIRAAKAEEIKELARAMEEGK